MNGWIGKILRVNLTHQKLTVESLDAKVAEDYIGGRGLGLKYLYDEIDPSIEPLSEENKIMFATGPLTGTGALAASRYTVVTKSPLTGAIANSNSGGYFPAEMKFAGYDMIILEGKAKEPTYLWIDNDQFELRSAEELWGKDVNETTEWVVEQTHPEAKVVCIGPAGENLVKFAAIMNDKGRAAGRSGVGAVMGSKNFKAIAIRGTNGVSVADPQGFMDNVAFAHEELKDPYMSETIAKYGTADVVEFSNEVGLLPTRNHQQGTFESAAKIGGIALAKDYNLKGANRTKACFSCPTACGRVTKVTEGKFKSSGEGPEYESMGALGSACGISNLEAVIKGNHVCNEMGMDTISAGSTIACAMELFEKGLIPKEDIGFDLNFGNGEGMVDLLYMAARREGFGDKVAEGSYRLASHYDASEYSMTSKKQEFPSYDPRGGQGFALGYATSNRGGCHIRQEVHCVEFFGISLLDIVETGGNLDRFATEGKPDVVKKIQDYYCMIDSSGICNFIVIATPKAEVLVKMIETCTGIDFGGLDGFLKTGERIFNLEKMFNIKAGFSNEDDTLPKRMLEEPFTEGPGKGHVVQLAKMLPEYYSVRGWNDLGVPDQSKLEELGIASI
ncbi:MAG: aldehyde ferredoxin oxidoreductase family protein [Deltaproteobacteria bacterium]|jgi:aldehyde:ferredoxin oxidoreductase|nr:aldehyde ferredoxin oxidoreductase family protein [Deltaproteobacteria bacterium]